MKKFKDIKWKQHKVVGKGAIQGLLMLHNGIEFSVVAGKGMYSTGKGGAREAIGKVEDASSFEVAIFDQNGKFIGADNDLVLAFERLDVLNTTTVHIPLEYKR